MKANELMIGDWVQITDAFTGKPIPCKITSIWENEYIALDGDIDATDLPTYLLAPTPLTPEILEKNGWYIPEDGLWYRHDMIPFLIALRTSGAYLYADEEHDKREFFCSIHSVHELQHALHLCGIDYEIKL